MRSSARPVAPPSPIGRGEHEHGVISPTPDKPRPGGRKNAVMDNTSQATAEPSLAAPASDPPASPADPVAPPPPPPRPASPPMDPDDEERHGPESRTIDKPRARGGSGRGR
ncbi:vegetative cell wall protein gp1 isoform X2 [Brachypodium distachyon]|uniref:vegetative cell wall protein gp1 isoform X2 n=1 Tax=Brachypodium distachyon TaxID=15368 RepID=UPI000D0D9016|nr:vegetative cell wall protein gp1 isoform X2 [Brachypodium distachyon]|eukprot:XP_024316682.1 vegetative cell wall protein gp1 isoform X2 [Brachypodium distachyon]